MVGCWSEHTGALWHTLLMDSYIQLNTILQQFGVVTITDLIIVPITVKLTIIIITVLQYPSQYL